MIDDLVAIISALGGFVGLGSLIAAIGAWAKSAQAAKQLAPNHGSSASDSLGRIEATQTAQGELIRSLGHQLGEIHERIITLERRE